MKLSNRLAGVACFAAIIGGMGLSPALAQEVPKMEMTTVLPEGITTPDNIQTRVGELNFFDGVPDVESAQKVYNLLDFTHAYQAFLDGTKIASMDAIRKGILEFGPANTTAVLFEGLMDSKALFLTANTTSVYMFSWLELGDEPMVIETPPNVLGFINDHWFRYPCKPDATCAFSMLEAKTCMIGIGENTTDGQPFTICVSESRNLVA